MRAVRIHQFGGPEVMQVEDIATPEPGPGEILVRIAAASANPVDYKIRNGGYIPDDQLPVTLGRDLAGVVERCGVDVTAFSPGEEVYAMLPRDRGAFADYAAFDCQAAARRPASLDMPTAAAVPLAGLTAWQGLFDHGRLTEGETVLIHGGSGGVGHFAVQFAKAHGARVIATASADAQQLLRDIGADVTVDYKAQRFEDAAQDVDLVYDLIGGETQDRSFAVLKRGGRLVSTVGEPDKAKAQAAGVEASRYMAQPSRQQLAQIAGLIDSGKVKVLIDHLYPLEQAAEAERRLEQDHPHGKIVLTVA